MKELFATFAQANRWANGRLYPELEKLTPGQLAQTCAVNFGSILGIANHLLLADRLWLYRFTGEGQRPATVSGIVHADMAELAAARRSEDARIIAFINDLSAARLAEVLHYASTDGVAHAQRLGLCIAHFFNHQTHHRGQMHGLLGAQGVSAPDLDLLYYQLAQHGEVA